MASNPWIVLAVLILGRAAFGLQFQSVGAVAPDLMTDLHLNYTSLGTLIGAYSALGLVVAVAAGWLIAKQGDRRILLGGLALMTAGGLLLAVAPGFAVALIGRIIAGAGSVLVVVVAPKMVMDRFHGATLPAAMGALMSAYPLGIGLGFMTLPMLGAWRMAMGAGAVFSLVALVAAACILRRPTRGTVAVVTLTRLEPGILRPLIVIGLVWALVNAAYGVMLGFAPSFYVHGGLSEHDAGLLGSIAAFTTVPLGPLGGWIVGRLGKPLLTNGVCIAAMAVTLALLPNGAAPVAIMVSMGVVLGLCAGPLMALPGDVLPPRHRALGMGLFYAIYYAGMTALPPIAGLAGDATASAAAPIYAASAFSLLALLALVGYGCSRPGQLLEARKVRALP